LPKLSFRYQEKGKPSAPGEISLPSFVVKPGAVAVDPHDELQLPPPLPEKNRQDLAWWMKTVGGSALAVCLIALIVSAMKTKSPADEARAAIASASGTPRQAISQICDAVRTQLQKAHGISAAHLTTPELLADAELLAPLSVEKRAALADLLPLADMLRFPQPEPTADDLERCRRIALRVVSEDSKG
jgi:hypothetical protein